jgi:hypothetical protein
VRATLWKEATSLSLHFLIATIGGMVLFTLFTVMAYETFSILGIGLRGRHAFVYDPFIWLPGLLLGLIVNRRMQNRSACLVGVVAGIFLIMVMRWDISTIEAVAFYRDKAAGHFWRYEFQQLFSPDDRTCATSECLGKLLFTAPFLLSTAYSLGAFLGLKLRKDNQTLTTVSGL